MISRPGQNPTIIIRAIPTTTPPAATFALFDIFDASFTAVAASCSGNAHAGPTVPPRGR